MHPRLAELEQELNWEKSAAAEQLRRVQKLLGKTRPADSSPGQVSGEIKAMLAGVVLPQTELQSLLCEEAYLADRLAVLELKLQKIARKMDALRWL